jgi:hypothetical protein
MKERIESDLSDEDMQNASAALLRASRRARELARQTGTEFVVIRDGQLIREVPPPVEPPKTNRKRRK